MCVNTCVSYRVLLLFRVWSMDWGWSTNCSLLMICILPTFSLSRICHCIFVFCNIIMCLSVDYFYLSFFKLNWALWCIAWWFFSVLKILSDYVSHIVFFPFFYSAFLFKYMLDLKSSSSVTIVFLMCINLCSQFWIIFIDLSSSLLIFFFQFCLNNCIVF